MFVGRIKLVYAIQKKKYFEQATFFFCTISTEAAPRSRSLSYKSRVGNIPNKFKKKIELFEQLFLAVIKINEYIYAKAEIEKPQKFPGKSRSAHDSWAKHYILTFAWANLFVTNLIWANRSVHKFNHRYRVYFLILHINNYKINMILIYKC